MDRLSLKDRVRSRYHWVVLAVVFLEFTISVGLANNLYSIYLIPISEGLQISRGTYSLSSGIRYLSAFFSNLLFGMLYRRHGFRKTASLALLLTGLAYVGYATATNMLPFCIGAVVVGLAESFCSTAGTSRLITDWFHRHQGLILGIVMASSGLGGSLFSILMSGIMEKSSFRVALMLSAGLILAAGVLVFLLVRDHPRKMGLEPYGEEHDRRRERQKYARDLKEWDGIPLSALKKMPCFYYMMAGTFLISFATYSVYPTVAAYAQDLGMPQSTAALIQSVMFLVLAAAKIAEGALSDRMGPKRVMILCIFVNIISMVLFILSKNAWMMILTVTVFSLPLAVPSIMLPVLTAEMFGRYDYSSILGVLLAMVSLSGVIAAPSVNFSYDLLGTYTPAHIVMAILSVAAILLHLAAFSGAERERKRYEEAQNA